MPPLWRGETCFIVAGGPSLRDVECGVLEGRRVIAINDAYRLCPFAGILYFCDTKWYRWHANDPEFRDVAGTKVRLAPLAAEPDLPEPIKILRNDDRHGSPGGLCEEPDGLRTGRNSGYQCINLAVHLGCKRIVLLGYDMKMAADGASHWFGDHPVPTRANTYREAMLPHFASLVDPLKARGVEVINATRGSAIDCFPAADLADLLEPAA